MPLFTTGELESIQQGSIYEQRWSVRDHWEAWGKATTTGGCDVQPGAGPSVFDFGVEQQLLQ